MHTEYDVIVYAAQGKVKIGTTSIEDDGAIRIFVQLQPLDGVFYLVPKTRKSSARK